VREYAITILSLDKGKKSLNNLIKPVLFKREKDENARSEAKG